MVENQSYQRRANQLASLLKQYLPDAREDCFATCLSSSSSLQGAITGKYSSEKVTNFLPDEVSLIGLILQGTIGSSGRFLCAAEGQRVVPVIGFSQILLFHWEGYRWSFEKLLKLHIFGWTQCVWLLYVDSDLFFLHSVDHIFEYPSMMAVSERVESSPAVNTDVHFLKPNLDNLAEILNHVKSCHFWCCAHATT